MSGRKFVRLLLKKKSDRTEIAEIKRRSKTSKICLAQKKIGEDRFISRWRRLGKVDVRYYRFFSNFIGSDPDILPGNICSQVIEPLLNPRNFWWYYEDKNMYGKMFLKEWQPKTILRNVNGFYYDEDYNLIGNLDEKILSNLVNVMDAFIIKPSIDSGSGKNVQLFKKEHDSFISHTGEKFSLKTLLLHYKKDFLIQECIKQSNLIAKYNISSVNTFRVFVYRSVKTGEMHVIHIGLKIGAKGNVIDNVHGGGCFVGIYPDGKFYLFGVNNDGEKIDHIDDIVFSSEHLEQDIVNRIKSFALDVSKEILHHKIIALDIALDEENKPRLIEFNISGFSYWYFQMAMGATFGDYTEEVIDYCSVRLKEIDYNIPF